MFNQAVLSSNARQLKHYYMYSVRRLFIHDFTALERVEKIAPSSRNLSHEFGG